MIGLTRLILSTPLQSDAVIFYFISSTDQIQSIFATVQESLIISNSSAAVKPALPEYKKDLPAQANLPGADPFIMGSYHQLCRNDDYFAFINFTRNQFNSLAIDTYRSVYAASLFHTEAAEVTLFSNCPVRCTCQGNA